MIVSTLFILLSIAAAGAAYYSDGLGALIPVIVFLCLGLVSVVVGLLGSNSAVSKIWGSK